MATYRIEARKTPDGPLEYVRTVKDRRFEAELVASNWLWWLRQQGHVLAKTYVDGKPVDEEGSRVSKEGGGV